jgi:hypothetical protein
MRHARTQTERISRSVNQSFDGEISLANPVAGAARLTIFHGWSGTHGGAEYAV